MENGYYWKKATDLLSSNLMYDLNEPNELGDIRDWFTPHKYIGIWWEMHMGKSTWDYGMTQDMGTWTDSGNAHGQHGATNKTQKNISILQQNMDLMVFWLKVGIPVGNIGLDLRIGKVFLIL